MEQKFAEKIKTPAYVFSIDEFKNQIQKVRDAWKDTKLCFSIKANPFLTRAAEDKMDYLEVCSPGELEICILQNIDPEKIIFSGVNKTEKSIIMAKDYGVKTFTAESLHQANMLEKVFSNEPVKCHVLLRLSAGSQLGMSETDFVEILSSPDQFNNLEIEGIHYFSGTQKKKAEDIKKELDFLDDFLKRMEIEHAFHALRVEYGTGLGVDYFSDGGDEKDDELLKNVSPFILDFAEKYNLTVEMGRFFAAGCGCYLTSVMDLKQVNGVNYAICDGGINHLKYQGQVLGMHCPQIEVTDNEGLAKASSETGIQNRECSDSASPDDSQNSIEKAVKPCPENPDLHTYCLCGSLCTTADVMARAAQLPKLEINDKLIFKKAGAYSATEGLALFLSRELPAIYVIKKGKLRKKRDITKLYRFNL